MSLTDDDGAVGHGEAAPLEPYDGISIARVERALEATGRCSRARRGATARS